ncbi:hypothetical protein MKZ08_14715 [Viridibacillus sp. FSL R5-0477]|uniref:hypothetical protein n=1 Tax=Viridibacillus TaxID=496496 RepID=UPI0004AE4B5D|nr:MULTISPECIES: hypothetical protein [Viridibacillus]OMC83890.1 hypothetical protein BK130_05085 [Viridibacillus sp. FSL H8-0123]OMC88411.1 hypothetical protein BK128_00205 [Viridibacillus sp. FSL H7-0596]OMC93050.1 hypothetical protein BK137_00525 [Viridibacillus arenosi]
MPRIKNYFISLIFITVVLIVQSLYYGKFNFELFILMVFGWTAGYLFSFYINKKRKAKTV